MCEEGIIECRIVVSWMVETPLPGQRDLDKMRRFLDFLDFLVSITEPIVEHFDCTRGSHSTNIPATYSGS